MIQTHQVIVPPDGLQLFLVLNWYFINENKIKGFCEENSIDHLSVTQWSRVGQIISLLKPFAKYTQLLEGDNINSTSIIIPSLIELEKHLENLSRSFF